MPIYKPSELKNFLNELGINPKKGLSQNFLLDGNIIRKIVELAELTSDDVVIEIGPGPGALTEIMLGTGATVLAVEKDRTLAASLERLNSPEDNLKVFCDDIMSFDIVKEVSPYLKGNKKAKVIANLPYHLTTPIMTHLIPKSNIFSRVVVMVQEEVARRFVGVPRTKEYGSLTVFLNYYSLPKYGFRVSRNCFYPKPNVDSAVVRFDLQTPPEVSSETKFFELTRTAFGQRRKMLSNTLGDLYPSDRIKSTLEELGKSSKARAEELSFEDFIELFKRLQD